MQATALTAPDPRNLEAVPVPPRQLRVLLVHERFAPDFGGGGERVVLAIAKHLIQSGVSLRVLTTGDPAITDYDGIPTERLRTSRHGLNFALPAIIRQARSTDLIQTFNYHACLPSLTAGRILHKPVVCMFLGLIQHNWLAMRGKIIGRAFRRWENFLVRRNFDRTLFLTEDNQQTALRLCNRPSHFLVIHPGIDADEFSPADQKENMVVFVGKFDVRKGVDDVLEVARALPDIPFVMIGWGALEEQLKSRATQNVRFYPIDDRQGLRRFLARATCFFLPSQGEGFPVALLEAMASGCAVVSTVPVDFAGARVSPGDRNAMISAIKKLWEDPAEAIRLGNMNAESATRFSWEAHVSRLVEIYREVLSERKG